MDEVTFKKFQDLIYRESGIVLKEGKESLVAARITKRMRALEITSDRAYYDHVVANKRGEEMVYLLDAISTNVTSFFREGEHFQVLASGLKALFQEKRQKIRIWSAASSTGEEPYSIAIVVSEVMKELGIDPHSNFFDVKILATDISTRVLAECKRGLYVASKVQSMRKDWIRQYFEEVEADLFEVSDDLKKLVTFSRINLSDTPFPMKGPFQYVFCRNVMIYFDNSLRERLVNEIHRLLEPGGVLFVGHSESLTGFNTQMKSIQPSVYQKGRLAA